MLSIFFEVWRTLFDLPGQLEESGKFLSRFRKPSPDKKAKKGSLEAYLEFQRASLVCLLNLNLVANLGTPPSFKGGMWTWPQVFRSFRLIMQESQAMMISMGRIAVLGSSEAISSSFELINAISEVGQAWPKKRRASDSVELKNKMNVANEKLRSFTEIISKEEVA